MTISKIAGIETEYGIMVKGADVSDPFLASYEMLRAYHASGNAVATCSSSPHMHMLDLMLANGARFYVDHGHPEYATPECISARQLTIADKAGERILAACQQSLNSTGAFPPGQSVCVYKNNSDLQHHSYGCHENYLLSAKLFTTLLYTEPHKILGWILPFLVTRTILCGSGKVGAENGRPATGFQLSQRADFFETLIGLQTTQHRPLFNTRDEAHADQQRLRRLHVITGDANMAEFSTYLKVGTMQLLLHMLEDDCLPDNLALANPLNAMQQVSRDLDFRQLLALKDGRHMTALDIQNLYLERAEQYLQQHESSAEQWEVLDAWGETLDLLPHRWQQLATRLDWAIKKRLLDRCLQEYGVSWQECITWQSVIDTADPLVRQKEHAQRLALPWSDYEKQRDLYFTLRRINLEYHDIRHDPAQGEIGLFYQLQQRGALERLSTDKEIESFISSPPCETRAWLRGHCIRRFAPRVLTADWSEIQFSQHEQQPSRAVLLTLPDPQAGTQSALANTWEQIVTAQPGASRDLAGPLAGCGVSPLPPPYTAAEGGAGEKRPE